MPENHPKESPLDLLQACRDELIAGIGLVRIVPQADPTVEHLESAEPRPGHRCDAAHREWQRQAAVLDQVRAVERIPR